MPDISTLIYDIQKLVTRKDGWFTDELAQEFGREVGLRLQEKFNEAPRQASLRLSKMGPSCPCALHYSIHHPELAEALPPWAEVKFSFGHIIEALAITLAKAAGHEVTGEQDAVIAEGITGHRDCVIDGCIVDVKSTSSFQFEKFKSGALKESDLFGYLDQLDGYLLGSQSDDLVRVKDRAFLFAIDKTLGHMCLYEHTFREDHIRERIASHKRVVALDRAPPCTCEEVPDGKSGNYKLGVKGSYSPFKYCCKPHLRTFIYSDGPRYLTKVARVPDVTEVDKHGKVIYRP